MLQLYLNTSYSSKRICQFSYTGRFRAPYMGAYMISKSAAVAFTEVLCQEMRDFGVRVISIEPEFFR